MIRLRHLSKTYLVRGQRKCVADNISIDLPAGRSIALLGRNGAGKSSLLRMLAGTMDPDSGSILISGSVSWPVGFAGSFSPDLTGAQNTLFIARVYGVETAALLESVERFAELGGHFNLPVRTYSAGMRSRLAFGISMGIKFDTYLVDEVTSVGDLRFREKSLVVFKKRLETSGAVVVSHSMPLIRKLCQHGMVLENGKLTYYDAVGDAIARHEGHSKPHGQAA
ncbi:ABC transporter ATP-binding protein [Aliiroseovarius sp. YM-037]|uniref:ABC transporter ATP-binding protein n=1 Tax=Aliiroseovarius sp. YM-037 TaxID=3341728 RepID=UPI003A809D0A